MMCPSNHKCSDIWLVCWPDVPMAYGQELTVLGTLNILFETTAGFELYL